MKKRWATILIFLFVMIYASYGQDTLKPEPGIFYSSKTEPHRGKEFASRVKYAKEEIVFSENKRIIEYCYYYDNERVCFGNAYEIIGDSILKINDAIWHYKKQGDKYILHRFFRGAYESGWASKLIPLATIGVFTTTTADRKDTLWSTDYALTNPANSFDRPEYFFYKLPIQGKIYDAEKIDQPPTFLNGDSITEISFKRDDEDVCYGEPLISRILTVSFVITAEGRIVNIEQKKGNLDVKYCPYYFMDIIRHISQLAPVMPAKRKNRNVNVRWIMSVNTKF